MINAPMPLENQVVSLEYAKRLKELGCPQQSLFHWGTGLHGEWSLNSPTRDGASYCSAYTVAELGAMLPFTIEAETPWGMKKQYLNSYIGYTKSRYRPAIDYQFYLYGDDDVEGLHPLECLCGQGFSDDNEANARAKMLIWLIENGHVKV